MKLSMKPFLVASALTIFTSVTLAQGAQPTPEERAYKFRTSLFETLAWKLGQMAGAQGQDDKEAFVQHAKDLAYLSTMIEEGFKIKDNLPDGTKAKPAIWEDYPKFQEKVANMAEIVNSFTSADAMADFDPREFGSKACGSCHRDFKIKD